MIRDDLLSGFREIDDRCAIGPDINDPTDDCLGRTRRDPFRNERDSQLNFEGCFVL